MSREERVKNHAATVLVDNIGNLEFTTENIITLFGHTVYYTRL